MSKSQFEHIRCRLERGVLVIMIAESQVQGDELSDGLRKEFFQAVEAFGTSRVVVDFQPVRYLGSAGFRPLLSLYRKLREQGGSMVFCNLAPQVVEVFHLTRLISTSRQLPAPFELAASLDEAVERQAQATASAGG